MAGRYLLEISAESVEAAVAAKRSGADRIELCSELAVGGLTPSAELMMGTRAEVQIPVFAMIRPRAGDFVYSEAEYASMRASIKLAKQLQLDGVVLGILTPERRVDVHRTRELVDMARGMEVTFHRAIDKTADLLEAVEDVAQTGASRILTSGGRETALAGAEKIAEMISRTRGRVVILAGAGINPGNVAEVARKTGAREFHSGLSSVLARSAAGEQIQAEVTRLAKELREIG
ncbi:MAG TPA: copper homeostasis protein CutC [Candidatus Dormibacteraeota bacterium]|nr:copper homeostasis protein CutC [Candidatus Dormibacteraeota bacterium]